MSDNIQKDLQDTAGDIAYTVVKAGLSSVPIVGGVASELFSMVLTAPVEKRKEEWLVRIYNTLQEVQKKIKDFQIENLANNEQFISIMTRASQLAVVNHQHEKLEALHNAVINTAINITIDENEKMMFLNMIDTFTPWHLKIIFYFDNPKLRLSEKNIVTNYYAGSAYEPLFLYYPELGERKDFVTLIVKELYRYGIMNTESLAAMMTADGMVARRLTEYGNRFYKYIKRYELD
jgi:hypothetical protein